MRKNILCWVLLAGSAWGQARPTPAEAIAEAMATMKGGQDVTVWQVQAIAEAHERKAVPALERQFASEKDSLTKTWLAVGLVQLGDLDDRYWRYLVDLARPGVESDAPSPFAFDSQGKVVAGEVSKEFLAWAAAHHLTVEKAADAVTYELPAGILFLAQTGDERGRDLLLRALHSPNYFVQAHAARGLAKLKDAPVDEIVRACRNAPVDVRPAIAMGLLDASDPKTRMAAAEFLPPEFFKDGAPLCTSAGTASRGACSR